MPDTHLDGITLPSGAVLRVGPPDPAATVEPFVLEWHEDPPDTAYERYYADLIARCHSAEVAIRDERAAAKAEERRAAHAKRMREFRARQKESPHHA